VVAPTRRGIIHRNGDECSFPIFGALRIETWHYDRQTGRSRSPPRNGSAEGNRPSSTVGGMEVCLFVRPDEAGRRWWARQRPLGAPLLLPPNAVEGRSALSPYVSKRPRRSWCTVGAWPARRMHAEASKVCQDGPNLIGRHVWSGVRMCRMILGMSQRESLGLVRGVTNCDGSLLVEVLG
jgi:hypothetical protein